ncbi:MAG: tyrosine-type recombinase/integrase [Actinomycetota bacterium]|nr:tyrosine-type recombinase/integrase [Actinomycetota bacterium]
MTFKSIFARRLADYIGLRQKLGYKMQSQFGALRMFDRYLCRRRHRGRLTQAVAVEFATSNPAVTRMECWRRYLFVRQFAEYLAIFDPKTPKLDPRALPRTSGRPPIALIFEGGLATLLEKSRSISPRHPIRGVTLHAMIGLAASTGLRIGEIVRLDDQDVQLDAGMGVLAIRATKFKKDRMVPVHPSTVAVLRAYRIARDAAILKRDCPAFFRSLWGRRYTAHTLEGAFCRLGREIGLRKATGPGPNFHCLRHRFAVQRLVSWYKKGVDVQTKLPALATYMGHVNYTSTAYYLTGTAELMRLAATRYHRASIKERE